MINKYKILLVLFVVCFVSSLILALTPTPPICAKGCDIVQTSKYAYTLGIKNNFYGVAIFALLSFLASAQIKKRMHKRKMIINYATPIGSAIALYFLYLQEFVLHAYCKYCMVVDFSLLAALLVVIFYKE